MQSNDARIIRGAAIPTAAVGVLAVAIGALVAGVDGASGVAFGVFIAAGFFGGGLLALGYVGRRWPDVFFGAAFMIYTTQMGILLVLLLLLRDASFLHGRAFAAGVLAGLVTWLAGQVRAHLRIKTLYVEPVTPSASAPASSGDRS
jgi:ATP synthase protein I